MYKYFFFLFFFCNPAISLELTKEYNTKIDHNIEIRISCNKNIFFKKINLLKLYIDDQSYDLVADPSFNKTSDLQENQENIVKSFEGFNNFDSKNSFRFQSVLHNIFNVKNNKIQYFYNDIHFKKENIHTVSFSTSGLYKKNFNIIKLKLDKKRFYDLKNVSIFFRSNTNLFQKINLAPLGSFSDYEDYIYLYLNDFNKLIGQSYFSDIYYITLFYKNNNSFEKKDFLKIKEISYVKNNRITSLEKKNLDVYFEIYENLLKVYILVKVPYDELRLDNIFTSTVKKITFNYKDKNEICKLL
jgi:hypothetical protein